MSFLGKTFIKRVLISSTILLADLPFGFVSVGQTDAYAKPELKMEVSRSRSRTRIGRSRSRRSDTLVRKVRNRTAKRLKKLNK